MDTSDQVYAFARALGMSLHEFDFAVQKVVSTSERPLTTIVDSVEKDSGGIKPLDSPSNVNVIDFEQIDSDLEFGWSMDCHQQSSSQSVKPASPMRSLVDYEDSDDDNDEKIIEGLNNVTTDSLTVHFAVPIDNRVDHLNHKPASKATKRSYKNTAPDNDPRG